MKPRIDYYLIPEQTEKAKASFACRIIEKAFQQKNSIYAHTSSSTAAHDFDALLWTFKDISFIPHNLIGEGNSDIQIGSGENDIPTQDILINLSLYVPDFFTKFKRIIEIVPQAPEAQQQARKNYKFYQNQGHTINTHDLRK